MLSMKVALMPRQFLPENLDLVFRFSIDKYLNDPIFVKQTSNKAKQNNTLVSDSLPTLKKRPDPKCFFGFSKKSFF